MFAQPTAQTTTTLNLTKVDEIGLMHTGHSGKPYKTTSAVTPTVTRNRLYGLIAICEAGMALVLLIIAGCIAYLTVSFLLWAIKEENVPPLGMFMAASIRVGAALSFGIPGLLLLMTARATREAAMGNEATSATRMRRAHWIMLFGILSIVLLCCCAVVTFFVALSLSNM